MTSYGLIKAIEVYIITRVAVGNDEIIRLAATVDLYNINKNNVWCINPSDKSLLLDEMFG